MSEFDRIKKMLDYQEDLTDPNAGQIVNLSLSTQERLDIFNEVLVLLDSGQDHRDIAQHVVGILNNHILLKMKQAKDRKSGKSPIFRRVDNG